MKRLFGIFFFSRGQALLFVRATRADEPSIHSTGEAYTLFPKGFPPKEAEASQIHRALFASDGPGGFTGLSPTSRKVPFPWLPAEDLSSFPGLPGDRQFIRLQFLPAPQVP